MPTESDDIERSPRHPPRPHSTPSYCAVNVPRVVQSNEVFEVFEATSGPSVRADVGGKRLTRLGGRHFLQFCEVCLTSRRSQVRTLHCPPFNHIGGFFLPQHPMPTEDQWTRVSSSSSKRGGDIPVLAGRGLRQSLGPTSREGTQRPRGAVLVRATPLGTRLAPYTAPAMRSDFWSSASSIGAKTSSRLHLLPGSTHQPVSPPEET